MLNKYIFFNVKSNYFIKKIKLDKYYLIKLIIKLINKINQNDIYILSYFNKHNKFFSYI
jgi:hypothetical protein